MSITWDQETMTTGLDEIDAQHRELIRRYNDLNEAVLHGRGHELVARTLAFLDEYTVIHFACEEARMIEHRCPASGRNRAAHEELRADLARIKERIASEGLGSIDVIHLEQALGNWIRNHICAIDVKLRESAGPQPPPSD